MTIYPLDRTQSITLDRADFLTLNRADSITLDTSAAPGKAVLQQTVWVTEANEAWSVEGGTTVWAVEFIQP